jgi:hypothetical protein
MARSFRTQQPVAAAKRREVQVPRIVTRRPRRGDRHPISARALRGILQREVPIEYLNGLERIELRPRTSAVVGDPFGCYLRDERVIILYSLPLQWTWDLDVSMSLLKSMYRFFAEIEECDAGLTITWPAPEVLSMWFFIEVLAHELGHHYRNQYRIRRGSNRHRRHEEFVADLHSARFNDALRRRSRAQRRRPSSPAQTSPR